MSPKLSGFGLVVVLGLAAGAPVVAQSGGLEQGAVQDRQPVKPTGPAAKKADDLIRSYTTRIEKEIEQGRKEVDRLRAELHELIDVRYEMAGAIADLHGELASKGTYSADPTIYGQAATQDKRTAPSRRLAKGCDSIATCSTVWEVPFRKTRPPSSVSSSGGWPPGRT